MEACPRQNQVIRREGGGGGDRVGGGGMGGDTGRLRLGGGEAEEAEAAIAEESGG